MTDRDWSVWVAERLGTQWTSDRIFPHLKPEVLAQVEGKWDVMEPLVKVRLLLSMAGIRNAVDSPLADSFRRLLTAASQDKDEWVRLTGSLLTALPDRGPISLDTSNPRANEMFRSLQETLSRPASKAALQGLVPLDRRYIPGRDEEERGGALEKHFAVAAGIADGEEGDAPGLGDVKDEADAPRADAAAQRGDADAPHEAAQKSRLFASG